MFQDVWNVKQPWVKFVVDEQRKLHLVRCKFCSKIDGKDKMLAPKIDSLRKHAIVAILEICGAGKYYMNNFLAMLRMKGCMQ